MKNNNHEEIQIEVDKKAAQKINKKMIKMKMSGKQVKNLQRIIIANKNKRVKKQS